jgi:hypothetical protein
MTPLGEWLKTHIPARVHPPGQFSAYGNYGPALVGYIIERVSGMNYDEYIEKSILTPLCMTHTTSRQPIPAALNADMTQGYIFANDEYQPESAFNMIANVAPAVAFRSTASDIARFMIAHLNDGRYGETSILQSGTARRMHRQSFSHDPRVNGMAHGFWELDMNGQTIIDHAGSHPIFNSLMMLLPDHHLGVFIATNSQGGNTFIGQNFTVFPQAFVDHYFPKTVPAITPPADFAQRARRFSGRFHLTLSRSDSTPEKLFAMLMAVKIQADQTGLNVTLPSGTLRFIEVDPLVFRRVEREEFLVFHEDADGAITEAFYSQIPITALLKSRWFETPSVNLPLLGLCTVLFLSALISALVAFFVRRKRANRAPSPRLAQAARLTAVLVSMLSPLILFSAFASNVNIYGVYIGELPLWTVASPLTIVVALLVLAMIVFTVLAWAQRFWRLTGRIHYTLVTLTAVGFVWFMSFWNLLGKSF